MPVTPSEILVARLAGRSFLSLWSESNPLARRGKELCDLLIVCDPDVVIVSVKEVALERGTDSEVDEERWRRRAIDKSVEQLYGAERQLGRMERVIRSDGSSGLALPPTARRRVHRVAVALGANRALPLTCGDLGKGYVHVFDELAIDRVIGELDTVGDFVGYLSAKEELTARSRAVLVTGGEEELLAVYLHYGRRFPAGADLLVVEPESWQALTAKPEWLRRKEADTESYVWDRLIELVIAGTGVPGSRGAQGLDERESVLRTMAREDRFARRLLAQGFNEFMVQAAAREIRARQVRSPSGVAYVFLAADRAEPREERVRELKYRCLVARGQQPDATTVVGLATERYVGKAGFSIDVIHLSIDSWTPEHESLMVRIQKDLGYFSAPLRHSVHTDEYPGADSGPSPSAMAPKP